MKPIIEVKGIWKEYARGAQKEQYLSLRDNLFQNFRKSKKESFWALQDINFEVNQGDSLAIIGKNGAGKSTLLKILSKITPPTKGEITLRGRLASLLEVGTGFHPELTGRENIYLNGSILGLRRDEIKKQFDAIVDFSGVEAFLETPLKHYSSGMQLRLAFSVAAHLEPEILVIDEVLAVGDSAFQQKCIDKMTEVSASGKTLLFVSHNLQAVKNLCHKGMLIKEGKLNFIGSVDETITQYVNADLHNAQRVDLTQIKERRGDQKVIFSSLEFNAPQFLPGDKVSFTLELTQKDQSVFTDADFGLAIQDSLGTTIHHLSNKFIGLSIHTLDSNKKYVFTINQFLKQGNYSLVLFLRTDETIRDWLTVPGALKISEGNIYGYPASDAISSIVQTPYEFREI